MFSLWLLDAGYSLCIARIDGNHGRGPDGAFQKKRSLGKMGLLKRMGLHSHTGLLLTPTYLTVVLVYVYVDVRQGIPLHILPTTVKTGVVCRPSEPEWGTRKPLPHVSPGQPPLAMKQINSLRQSELRKRERERERSSG